MHIEPHNFYWQRVVEYRGTPSAMRDRIIASGIFSDIQRTDSTMIVGRVENVLLNYATMEPEPRLFSRRFSSETARSSPGRSSMN